MRSFLGQGFRQPPRRGTAKRKLLTVVGSGGLWSTWLLPTVGKPGTSWIPLGWAWCSPTLSTLAWRAGRRRRTESSCQASISVQNREVPRWAALLFLRTGPPWQGRVSQLALSGQTRRACSQDAGSQRFFERGDVCRRTAPHRQHLFRQRSFYLHS